MPLKKIVVNRVLMASRTANTPTGLREPMRMVLVLGHCAYLPHSRGASLQASLAGSRIQVGPLQTPHFPPSFAQCLQYLQFLQALHGSEPVQVDAAGFRAKIATETSKKMETTWAANWDLCDLICPPIIEQGRHGLRVMKRESPSFSHSFGIAYQTSRKDRA
jgi:hypothetical protein